MSANGEVPECRGLSELAGRYRRLICDIWGVLHDGGKAFPDAVAALTRARETGAAVLALSNSPKRAHQVRAQLAEKGIDDCALDHVFTSGELTRSYLERHYAGRRVFHLGPSQDRATVEGTPLDEVSEIARAEVVVATGLVHSTVEAHAGLLQQAIAAGADFLCANPDRVVRLGGTRELCAGVLADRYEELGGRVVWLGKPAAPPYRACRRWFASTLGDEDDGAVLAIGDGLATDILGARQAGLAALLIEEGIHREEIAEHGRAKLFARYGVTPDCRMPHLRW